MYKVLEKLRAGEPLSDRDEVIHAHSLVFVLKKIHDDLDAVVFAAYGWPPDLTDEQILEKLVTLNAERAEEERNGHIRWLHPDFQNPVGARAATQEALVDPEPSPDDAEPPPRRPSARPWPRPSPAPPGADVEQVLESFAALGLLLRYDTPQGPRWKVPGKQTG